MVDGEIWQLSANDMHVLRIHIKTASDYGLDLRQQREHLPKLALNIECTDMSCNSTSSDLSFEQLQGYTVCVLEWATVMRTGSYSKRSRAPKSRTPTNLARFKKSGPLRWQDVEFFMLPSGIGAKITFCHWKENISPDAASKDTFRVMTCMPIQSTKLHHDLAGLLSTLETPRDPDNSNRFPTPHSHSVPTRHAGRASVHQH
jgi:hypothetical protein